MPRPSRPPVRSRLSRSRSPPCPAAARGAGGCPRTCRRARTSPARPCGPVPGSPLRRAWPAPWAADTCRAGRAVSRASERRAAPGAGSPGTRARGPGGCRRGGVLTSTRPFTNSGATHASTPRSSALVSRQSRRNASARSEGNPDSSTRKNSCSSPCDGRVLLSLRPLSYGGRGSRHAANLNSTWRGSRVIGRREKNVPAAVRSCRWPHRANARVPTWLPTQT